MALFDDSGTLIDGTLHEARPEAVVLVHEVFGLTNQIKYAARRFAAEGFTTFAIDLFAGRASPDHAKAAKLALGMSWKTAIDRIRAVVLALSRKSEDAKVGICGFGFGGGVALIAAAHIPEIAACVTFYGVPTAERGDVTRIKCKILGHFGELDKLVTPDRVAAFEARLEAAGNPPQIHRYTAGHFFFNDALRATYSPHNAELAYRRTVAFLKHELTGSWPET